MPAWDGKWEGGRTFTTKDGRRVWVIQKDVHGVTRSITLEARNLEDARAEFALFNRDRAGYLTGKQEAAKAAEEQAQALTEAVYVDPQRVAGFLAYLAKPTDKPPRSAGYITNTRSYLSAWAHVLGPTDLRFAKLSTLQRALEKPLINGKPMPRKKAIIALKSFTSWLESRGHLEPGQNAARGLKVPAARRVAEVQGYSLERIQATYKKLTEPKISKTRHFRSETAQAVRDVFQIAAQHGLHFSEIERIALGAPIRILDPEADIAAVVEFTHKNGDRHALSLIPATLAAALRLQAQKTIPVESLVRKYLTRAAEALGEPERLHMGQLRHSFITLAQECGEVIYPASKGVPLALVSQAVGHKSTTTSQRFYSNVQVPPLVRLPLVLTHPDDP